MSFFKSILPVRLILKSFQSIRIKFIGEVSKRDVRLLRLTLVILKLMKSTNTKKVLFILLINVLVPVQILRDRTSLHQSFTGLGYRFIIMGTKRKTNVEAIKEFGLF